MDITRINDFSEILNDEWDKAVEIDWHGQKLVIYRYLPLPNATALIRAVTSSCFNSDTGEYIPEIRDFAEKIAVIAAYTNVEIPEDGAMQYRLVYQTDLNKLIEENADSAQYSDIVCAIADGIRTTKHANKLAFEKQAQSVIDNVNKFVDQIKEAISGVTSEDLATLINAIINGNIDDGDLLKGVIAQGEKEDNGSEQ